MPLISGMRLSETITETSPVLIASKASRPDVNVRISSASSMNNLFNEFKTFRSSSKKSTFSPSNSHLLVRDFYHERRPFADLAFNVDLAIMLFDDIVCNGEAEARAFAYLFRSEERLEHLVELGLRYPATRVGYGHPHVFVLSTGADSDFAVVFHGLRGVHKYIHEDLAQPLPRCRRPAASSPYSLAIVALYFSSFQTMLSVVSRILLMSAGVRSCRRSGKNASRSCPIPLTLSSPSIDSLMRLRESSRI